MAVGLFMSLWSWRLPTEFQTLSVFVLMLVYVLVRSHAQAAASR